MKGLGSINDIWEIEIDYVIACNNIWINVNNEVSPSLQQFLFIVEGMDLASDNWSTVLKSEDISHKWFFLTMNFDNVRDLNDWVCLCLRELAFFSRTLNVERKNS